MDKLQTIYGDLKLVASSKLYLVNYFDEIRNSIDIECQTFLDKPEATDELKEKATQQQLEMIEQVGLFEKSCLSELEKSPLEQLDLEELDRRVKSLDLKDKKEVEKLEKEFFCEAFNRKKRIFMNKGCIFLAKKPKRTEVLFGILLFIEDEFVINSENDDKFQHLKE
jgi:hypothetical protein